MGIALQEETGLASSSTSQFGIPVSITSLPDEINNGVESNTNVQEVAKALEGDANTAWDSCVPQARGQWFRLNLSKPRLLDGIQFLVLATDSARIHFTRLWRWKHMD
jgi:hypothetical protein